MFRGQAGRLSTDPVLPEHSLSSLLDMARITSNLQAEIMQMWVRLEGGTDRET